MGGLVCCIVYSYAAFHLSILAGIRPRTTSTAVTRSVVCVLITPVTCTESVEPLAIQFLAADSCRPQWRFHAGARGHRPQIVTRPPNLAVFLTHCILILRKINEFDATRCQILRLKCTKFDFR